MTTKTFGAVLKEERERLDLTQTETAALLDIPFRTYWAWENEESEPPTVAQEGALARLKKARCV